MPVLPRYFLTALLAIIPVTVVGVSLMHNNIALGDEPTTQVTTVPPPTTEAAPLLDTAIFRESEQNNIRVNTLFSDESTNIAFYIKCPSSACPDDGTPESPVYVFSAENLGRGTLPFSEYWAPPALTDYLAIEYKNDEQQFTCSDKTVDECKGDSRYISSYEFSLVSDSTDITPEMLAGKNISSRTKDLSASSTITLKELSISLSAPFITSDLVSGQIVTAILDNKSSHPLTESTFTSSTPSAALKKLSIDLSATSITSNLEDGEIVTAVLDNKPSRTPEPEVVEEATSTGSVGGFIMGIVNSIIYIFTPDSSPPPDLTPPIDPIPPIEVTPTETPVVPEEAPVPTVPETPPVDTEILAPIEPHTEGDTPLHETPPTETE